MSILRSLVASSLLAGAISHHQLVAAEPFPDPDWKYLLRFPGKGWFAPGFDDSKWRSGPGGFGERSTPGARVGTDWTTKNIWLRRSVDIGGIPAKPALYLYHDEDAKVFVNGKLAAEFSGFVTEYIVHPIPADLLKPGENQLAVTCKQTTGGQAIDVHIIDAENVPTLPEPKRPERPFQSELITEWGARVTPENAWTEYPRPQFVRDQWENLNGLWDYAITTKEAPRPAKWDGQILVPFAIESKLSGVGRLLHGDQALWYRRPLPAKAKDGHRLLLNFEAVDYHCDVWVNNTKVGSHTGGSTPFSFDVTTALNPDGDNNLVVRVEDATDGFQLKGKQTTDPRGIWYTQVSGIWGTVWTEEVPESHLSSVSIRTSNDGTLTFEFVATGGADELPIEVTATLDGEKVARDQGSALRTTLKIPGPRLWSPASPTLYKLEFRYGADVVKSYAGIREIGKVKDAGGHLRFTLNGEPIFHWGPLDQGWWPDGLLTPPSDEAMRWDVDYLKAAGFNMIRKHIKIEPRRFYAYCDEVGMLVWQDQPSGGPKPPWTRLQPNPQDAVWPDADHEQYLYELDRMITTLENHPSIVQWVPFNEAWGQHRTMAVGEWTVERDPTRHVNIASGGNFWPVGDIVDHHSYPHPAWPHELDGGRFDGFIKVMGEFGGHGLPSPGHLWDNSRRNWGYGGLPKNAAEYKDRYLESLRILAELKREHGIAGGVYTQTTDVEGEINGLVSYDRKVIKIPATELKKLHARLLQGETPPVP